MIRGFLYCIKLATPTINKFTFIITRNFKYFFSTNIRKKNKMKAFNWSISTELVKIHCQFSSQIPKIQNINLFEILFSKE